jgi:hypothetical protein
MGMPGFGRGGNGPGGGGIPVLPPAGAGMGGMMMPGMPGGAGMSGYPGMEGAEGGFGGAAAGQAMPEYSNAILWIYDRKPTRLEFLINEDGRIAQISVAAPSGKTFPGARTSRGVTLGSSFGQVMAAYGNPERHRMLPGFRFYEAYYTKNHHAAFTFDTKKNMKVVRITIALAD